jgi:alpha-L-glutamate ligase-like protein
MHWLFSWRRLKSLGVIGLNARNAGGVMGHNPRAAFPLVDDKILMWELCRRVGIPAPETRGIFETHGDLRHLGESLAAAPDGVLKPARGAGGRGVMVLLGEAPGGYRRAGDAVLSLAAVRRHASDILSGLHSIGGKPDRAILQQRVGVHPALAAISYAGTPDVRVLVYRGVPAMAMLRLPTLESAGRANLHQGGIGVGVDLATGTTTRAVWHGQRIDRHPDTGAAIPGLVIPDWPGVLDLAKRAARATGLGYLGADIVLDPDRGPLLLEANARPGLAIQLANGKGLGEVLTSINALNLSELP